MNKMWCNQCQQDVPGMASAEGGKFCCPRCGGGLCPDSSSIGAEAAPQHVESSVEHAQHAPPNGPAAAEADSAPLLYDGWELDQRLQHIERVLGVGESQGSRSQDALRQELARLDPPHAGPARRHRPPTGRPVRPPGPEPMSSRYALAAFTWPAVLLGTMAFVCGGVLLGWSLVTGRAELWTIGMPIAVFGQLALLVGLLLQLDRLWRDSRHAATKLDDVDEQLHQLKTATTMFHAGHGSPAGAFYSHLVDGAGPQLLLADLKSQLDLLALKMSMND